MEYTFNNVRVIPVDVATSTGKTHEEFNKLFAGEKILACREVYYSQSIKNK